MSPDKPIDLSQSVAGEEDPGASIDLAMNTPERPGDEAPEGARGTGEKACPQCGGSGRVASGPCPTCLGTGTITAGIGGG